MACTGNPDALQELSEQAGRSNAVQAGLTCRPGPGVGIGLLILRHIANNRQEESANEGDAEDLKSYAHVGALGVLEVGSQLGQRKSSRDTYK